MTQKFICERKGCIAKEKDEDDEEEPYRVRQVFHPHIGGKARKHRG